MRQVWRGGGGGNLTAFSIRSFYREKCSFSTAARNYTKTAISWSHILAEALGCETFQPRRRQLLIARSPDWAEKFVRRGAEKAKRLMFAILSIMIEKLHREDKPRVVP